MFLASEDASFITGEILTMDGGLSLASPSYKDWIAESVSGILKLGGPEPRTGVQPELHYLEGLRSMVLYIKNKH